MSQNSKTAIKSLFVVDEKVLCYEPDPTKARVLYDSKVLEVVERKDKSKKCIEYRIHFQGWNSSWDRFVGEKYILKRDEENLILQDDLREKAKVLNEALRLKKKKNQYSLKDLIRASMDKSTNGTEEVSIGGSTSGDSLECDTSDDEVSTECVPLVIPDSAKRRLEDDYYFITEDQKLVQVPAKRSVVRILEDYVKHYALTELSAWIEVMKNRPAQPTPVVTIPTPTLACSSLGVPPLPPSSQSITGATGLQPKILVEEKIELDELYPIVQRVQLVKEVVEGVRVMFDFLITQILLYKEELDQFYAVRLLKPRESVADVNVSDYIADADYVTKSDCDQDSDIDESNLKKSKGGKKNLKKGSTTTTSDSNIDSTLLNTGSTDATVSPTGTEKFKQKRENALKPYRKKINEFLKCLMEWKLIPHNSDQNEETNPSFLYGSIHLLRLFVKLPEILSQTNMPRRRLSVVVKLLNQFIDYMSRSTKDSFGPFLYDTIKRKSEETSSDEDNFIPPKKSWKARTYSK